MTWHGERVAWSAVSILLWVILPAVFWLVAAYAVFGWMR